MKTLAEKIAVMQAAERGEQIEFYFDGEWKDCDGPLWDWVDNNYRVKPKQPKETKYLCYSWVGQLVWFAENETKPSAYSRVPQLDYLVTES